ncbi:MAG: glycosyltransferase, partial [Gaiellales bacterium]
SEGFGNGLVEAMACERVAVAAAAGGQLETFAGIDGVLTVPVNDSAALTGALRELIATRPTWRRRGLGNRAHVVERHSMRRWAAEMANAYAELVPSYLELGAAGASAARTTEVA